MTAAPTKSQKTLELRQTWFLAATALAVVFMFAFVILPYVDPKQPGRSLAGQEAQDFDLELLSGGAPGDRIALHDLLGKIVILDFWASWCKPCREQSAQLQSAVTQLGDRVRIVGIATSDQRQDAIAYLSESKSAYSNAFDEEGRVGRSYQVDQLPTLIFVNALGQIRARHSRILSSAEIVELVKELEDQ